MRIYFLKLSYLIHASIILLLFLTYSCKKNEPVPAIDLGKDYFPIKTGNYIIYDVDSTVYDEITHLPTTFKYRLKEIITQSYQNDEGTTSYKLERYIKWYDSTKTYDQIPWQFQHVWTIIPYNTSVEEIEENIRYVKIIFPVKQNAQWDGNAKNTLGTKIYTYNYIDNSETINGVSLSKVLSIRQYQYRSLIQYQNEVEKYARNIGQVYKEITHLESQTIIPNVPVENRPEKGFIYKKQLVQYFIQ